MGPKIFDSLGKGSLEIYEDRSGEKNVLLTLEKPNRLNQVRTCIDIFNSQQLSEARKVILSPHTGNEPILTFGKSVNMITDNYIYKKILEERAKAERGDATSWRLWRSSDEDAEMMRRNEEDIAEQERVMAENPEDFNVEAPAAAQTEAPDHVDTMQVDAPAAAQIEVQPEVPPPESVRDENSEDRTGNPEDFYADEPMQVDAPAAAQVEVQPPQAEVPPPQAEVQAEVPPPQAEVQVQVPPPQTEVSPPPPQPAFFSRNGKGRADAVPPDFGGGEAADGHVAKKARVSEPDDGMSMISEPDVGEGAAGPSGLGLGDAQASSVPPPPGAAGAQAEAVPQAPPQGAAGNIAQVAAVPRAQAPKNNDGQKTFQQSQKWVLDIFHDDIHKTDKTKLLKMVQRPRATVSTYWTNIFESLNPGVVKWLEKQKRPQNRPMWINLIKDFEKFAQERKEQAAKTNEVRKQRRLAAEQAAQEERLANARAAEEERLRVRRAEKEQRLAKRKEAEDAKRKEAEDAKRAEEAAAAKAAEEERQRVANAENERQRVADAAEEPQRMLAAQRLAGERNAMEELAAEQRLARAAEDERKQAEERQRLADVQAENERKQAADVQAAEEELAAEHRRLVENERQRVANEQAAEDERQRVANEQAAEDERQRVANEQAAEDERQRVAERAAEEEQQHLADEKARREMAEQEEAEKRLDADKEDERRAAEQQNNNNMEDDGREVCGENNMEGGAGGDNNMEGRGAGVPTAEIINYITNARMDERTVAKEFMREIERRTELERDMRIKAERDFEREWARSERLEANNKELMAGQAKLIGSLCAWMERH